MSSIVLQRQSIPLIPVLAREIGTNEALVLQQIGYWLERSKTSYAGKKWVYNTTKEWVQKEFCFMSESTLKRTLTNLKNLGLIESKKLSKRTGYHINYYTINFDALAAIDEKIKQSDLDEIKGLSVDDLESIGSDCNSIGSDCTEASVKLNQSRTVQNDTTISKSTKRLTSEINNTIVSEKSEADLLVDFWNENRPSAAAVKKEVWSKIIKTRLKTFSADEIKTAMLTVINSQWHQQNKQVLIKNAIDSDKRCAEAIEKSSQPQQTNYQGNNHAHNQSANNRPQRETQDEYEQRMQREFNQEFGMEVQAGSSADSYS